MISVIICCHNSAERIAKVLEHLQGQAGMDDIPWEVILVDNNCTDRTQEVAQEVWQTNPVVPLRIVEERRAGLMNARIKGIETASYRNLCFVDDDNWLADDYLITMMGIFDANPQVGIIGGESIAVFETGISPPDWFQRFESSYAVGKRADRSGIMKDDGYVYGAGMGIRKEGWEILMKAGFEPKLTGRKGKMLTSGEDTEMQLAFRLMKYKIFYSSKLKFQHLMPPGRLTWDYLLRMKEGFGAADLYLGMYQLVLNRFVWRNMIRRFWLTDFLFSIIVYCLKMVVFFPDSVFEKEGSFKTASIHHSKGRIKFSWQARGTYAAALKRIEVLTVKLGEFNHS